MMKRSIMVGMILLAMMATLLCSTPCFSQNYKVEGDGLNFKFSDDKIWTLSMTDDGQLEIDGKPIKELSHPELKAIMLDIADYLKQNNSGMVDYLGRQTDYLLKELEKCQELVSDRERSNKP